MSAINNYFDNYLTIQKDNMHVIPSYDSSKDYTIWEAICDAFENHEGENLPQLFGKSTVLAFAEHIMEVTGIAFFPNVETYNFVNHVNTSIAPGMNIAGDNITNILNVINLALNMCLADIGKWQVKFTLYYFDMNTNTLGTPIFLSSPEGDKYIDLAFFEAAPATTTMRAKYAAFSLKYAPKINASYPYAPVTPLPTRPKYASTTTVTTPVPAARQYVQPTPPPMPSAPVPQYNVVTTQVQPPPLSAPQARVPSTFGTPAPTTRPQPKQQQQVVTSSGQTVLRNLPPTLAPVSYGTTLQPQMSYQQPLGYQSVSQTPQAVQPPPKVGVLATPLPSNNPYLV
nr:hypothetical protein K-LCC10_0092 [Kaumoebavirus]